MGPFTTDKLRNIVLLSHSGAGKTSLAEAMLFTSGSISRMGRTEDRHHHRRLRTRGREAHQQHPALHPALRQE